MGYRIGFTGTRHGMTPEQASAVAAVMGELGMTEFHHGDCIGADKEANDIALWVGIEPVIHPPVDEAHRAFCASAKMREPKRHFARNRDIVDETDHLIATPWQAERPAPKSGGGTWYTIEYAEKRGKPVTIIWPSGKTTTEA
jgi:hypothetical protein